MDREDTIEKEQAGEERARTQVLRAQETGTKYESTMETLRQAEQELPSFSGSYDDEIGRLYDRIINREGFRYDMNSDPLYMSYRDRYAREGRLAMKNTMGQAAALRESFPEFSLEREMEDPEFLRLTAPHTGLTLADAYYALHREEIGAMAARRSLEALTRAVSYGGARPREIAGNMAASSMTADPRSMSRDEREALKKRIYEAKAQGVKLPYGG